MSGTPSPSPFRLGGPFFLIAGPCVLEERKVNVGIARHVREVSERCGIPAYFKASFDKANRTSLQSPRGPGLQRGLKLLEEVRDTSGLPVLTDVHEPAQVEVVAEVVDALQIPAFLSRQTDLLLAAGSTGLPVNVKKGQWMAPEQIAHSVAKVRSAGASDLAVTERGTAFGYGRWMVDMRSFTLMRQVAACPALFDGTHAVQLPGAGEHRSGGEPTYVEPLCRAAVAAGADGLFLEVHPDPPTAGSDADSMLGLTRLEPLLVELLRIREAVSRDVGGDADRSAG